MAYPHWRYFLALEADLKEIGRYIEISPDNFSTYSIEIAHLYLAVGSEVDVVAKALSNQSAPQSTHENMDQYRGTLSRAHPKLHTLDVFLPRYGLALLPWREWDEDKNPPWWRQYNAVKHRRDTEFKQANLENAVNALAGLFALVLYFYQPALYDMELEPMTELFELDRQRQPGTVVSGRFELPDYTYDYSLKPPYRHL